MTVLVDTYDVPACTIMSQLYNTVCYEILPDEVYSKRSGGAASGKKYIVLTDISPKTLLAVRDVESVIYVFHSEILSEKEYKMLQHYTNELICVENNTVRVVNKKTCKQEVYQIFRTKQGMHIGHTLRKIEDPAPASLEVELLTEKQRRDKAASLPFLQVQEEKDVYFPSEEEEEEEV